MAIRDSRESYNKYMREYHLRRYHDLRKEALLKLGNKCSRCGSTEDLQIDHIKPENKVFEVSRFLSVSKDKFLLELKKCQILCAKCHRLKSILEQGNVPLGTHGTLNMYSHGKCRCLKCKNVWNEYGRKYKREWRRKRLIS